jgi:hypothetical protein
MRASFPTGPVGSRFTGFFKLYADKSAFAPLYQSLKAAGLPHIARQLVANPIIRSEEAHKTLIDRLLSVEPDAHQTVAEILNQTLIGVASTAPYDLVPGINRQAVLLEQAKHSYKAKPVIREMTQWQQNYHHPGFQVWG